VKSPFQVFSFPRFVFLTWGTGFAFRGKSPGYHYREMGHLKEEFVTLTVRAPHSHTKGQKGTAALHFSITIYELRKTA
jgi:hypothetical protein